MGHSDQTWDSTAGIPTRSWDPATGIPTRGWNPVAGIPLPVLPGHSDRARDSTPGSFPGPEFRYLVQDTLELVSLLSSV